MIRRIFPFAGAALVGFVLVTAAFVGSLFAPPATAFTLGRLVAGQSLPAVQYGTGGSWCAVSGGLTTLDAAFPTEAAISFAELTYYDGLADKYYRLDGQDRLSFADTQNGQIKFKQTPPSYPASVVTSSFVNFTAVPVSQADRKIFSFNIVFEHCTLPIYAVYDAAP